MLFPFKKTMSHKASTINQEAKVVRLLPQKVVHSFPNLLNPLANLLAKLHINPNTISTFSLAAGIGAGIFYVFNLPLPALIFVILCGILDTVDGKVAVHENKKSAYGAMYDSSLDRYAEFFIYLGIAFYFRKHWAIWITFGAILGSFMVSYTRARAEGLGIKCRIGIMQRAERIVVVSLGTLTGIIFHVLDSALIVALVLITFFSNITALQRIFFVRKKEKERFE